MLFHSVENNTVSRVQANLSMTLTIEPSLPPPTPHNYLHTRCLYQRWAGLSPGSRGGPRSNGWPCSCGCWACSGPPLQDMSVLLVLWLCKVLWLCVVQWLLRVAWSHATSSTKCHTLTQDCLAKICYEMMDWSEKRCIAAHDHCNSTIIGEQASLNGNRQSLGQDTRYSCLPALPHVSHSLPQTRICYNLELSIHCAMTRAKSKRRQIPMCIYRCRSREHYENCHTDLPSISSYPAYINTDSTRGPPEPHSTYKLTNLAVK